MLKTVLGDIIIAINSQNFNLSPIKLSNIGSNYIVDERYKIVVDNIDVARKDMMIDCLLKKNEISNLTSYPEPGENLALISFISDDIKLSIGVEGDIPGVSYEYNSEGLRVKIDKETSIKKIIFFIAWKKLKNEQEEIYTWFAADPTLEV